MSTMFPPKLRLELSKFFRKTRIIEHVVRNKKVTSVTNTQNVTWECAKPFSEIPGDFMLPFIGSAWMSMPIIGRYKQDLQHVANRDKRRRLGEIVREKIGPLNVVMCFSNKDAEKIVKTEGVYPLRSEFSTIKAYRESRKEWFSTTGLLVLQGKEWHDLRVKTQKHLMKPKAIHAYLEPMHDVAKDFVRRIFEIRNENKEVNELLDDLYKWALESVTLVGLDTRLGCLQSNLPPESDGMKMIESVLTQFECMNKLEAFLGNIQFWKIFPTPTWRKFEKASDTYSEIAFKYINKAVEDLKSHQGNPNKQLTLLQAMLTNKDLDVGDAVVFVADMLLAGIETTSHTSGFLFYHLAKNPEKQDILYKEIKQHLSTKDVKFTSTIYESLKYAHACFKESLRLNPIVGGTARILASDAVLSGYQVPKGTLVFVPYEEVFMNEERFKNPEQFNPERWLNKDEKIDPFSYFPFGFGPRSCIGRRLAEVEVITLVTEIVRNFRIEYHYEDIGFFRKAVNVPDKPLRFKFIER